MGFVDALAPHQQVIDVLVVARVVKGMISVGEGLTGAGGGRLLASGHIHVVVLVVALVV